MNVTRKQRKDIMNMSQNLSELNDIIGYTQGLESINDESISMFSTEGENFIDNKNVNEMCNILDNEGIDGVASLYSMQEMDDVL